jgi:hypothetical protein
MGWPVMQGVASGIGVAVTGLCALALARLADPGSGPVAALVPPWQEGGLARAAALDMAVIDIRWDGHLLVVDPGQTGRARLRGQGLWLLRAASAGLCAAPARQEGTGT